MRQILPVAGAAEVRRYARALARRHPRELAAAVALHCLAAMAGLAAPRLIGDLVESVEDGTSLAVVDRTIALIAAFLVAQTVLTRYARMRSFTLGETVLAELRENFVEHALALPVGVVERAGTGDLLTRTSRDVDALGWSVRFAVPETIIALVTTLFTIGACVLVGPWVA
ncbi:MAG: ABC transporter transmembrane domain-containing protein, partial [Nocardioidaceae bacterium]